MLDCNNWNHLTVCNHLQYSCETELALSHLKIKLPTNYLPTYYNHFIEYKEMANVKFNCQC